MKKFLRFPLYAAMAAMMTFNFSACSDDDDPDGLMIQEGSSVKATGRIAQIPVSEAYLGRVINALAKPIDGGGDSGDGGIEDDPLG